MANDYKAARARDVGTTPVTVYTAVGFTSFVAEIDVCNILNTGVQCTVEVYDGANATRIVKDAPIPTGSALSVVTEQRIVLEPGESIRVYSNVASSLDVNMSIMEDVNS